MYDWYHATAIPSSLGPVKSRMVCLSGARNSHGDSKFIYCPCVLWMKYNVVDIIYVYCQLNSLYCYWKASEFDKKTVEIRFNSLDDRACWFILMNSEKRTLGIFWLNTAETWVDISSNTADRVRWSFTISSMLTATSYMCCYVHLPNSQAGQASFRHIGN